MKIGWIVPSPSLNNGIKVINHLDDTRFEQFLNRVIGKVKERDSEIFTAEEKKKLEIVFQTSEENIVLAIKTTAYLFKRMLKFLFMPVHLKNDLLTLGLISEKVELFVKVWSAETRSTLDEIGSNVIDAQGDTNLSWKLNAELSSDNCKKSKVPKVYLSMSSKSSKNELELMHPELYSMFLQFESIQHELDLIL